MLLIWSHHHRFRDRKRHKHKQTCGIVPGLGGRQKFVCVCVCFFFWVRVILYGGEKRINKIPPKSRDNPVRMLFTCSFLYVFFSLPNIDNDKNDNRFAHLDTQSRQRTESHRVSHSQWQVTRLQKAVMQDSMSRRYFLFLDVTRGPPMSTIACRKSSSTELESGKGAFLQTPAPLLDKMPEPMGARIFVQYWAGSWQSHRESTTLSPALGQDKNRSP